MVKVSILGKNYDAISIDKVTEVDYARLYPNSTKLSFIAFDEGNYKEALFWQEKALVQYSKMSYDARLTQSKSHLMLVDQYKEIENKIYNK